eukprot:TRINITY_DN435_c0_g4_i1.p1 TRINITY_DN435_c0_g4~~TRINITY_DN435_c0_g4_i1.p1  ORF type:complete len:640 (+),score=223.28 TRINITY_DN435_c0_g4_i1:74-1921(+)
MPTVSTPIPASAEKVAMLKLPHSISIMNAVDFQTHSVPCDLATLNLGQLYMFCTAQFNAVLGSFELLHANNILANDSDVKAIDIGLSNNMFVMMQPKGSYNPSLDMMAQMQNTLPMPCSPGNMLPSPGNMLPSPPMVPSPQMLPSPTLSPTGGPMMDPALDMQYDLAMASVASQMQLQAALGLPMSMSPTGSPHNQVLPTSSLPMPVSPPMFGAHPMPMKDMSRVSRPTGSINLNNMGDLCSFAITNEGSRALVAAIEEVEDANSVTAKINELVMKFAMVASHQHGSKVVRALIKSAKSPEQITLMLKMACNTMLELCDSNTGSDVLVEVIQASTAQDDASIVMKQIIECGPRLFTIINGRKVIQAVLTRFNAEFVEPIFDIIGHHLLHLATDQIGCVTIQRCLDHASSLKLKMQLQLQIMEATRYLISDMYGNYVLQHSIKGDPCYSQVLSNKFKGHVAELAVNKYASCVIEKCLLIGSDETREQIALEVVKSMKALMWDGFGNFVVQSVVDHAPAHMVDMLKDIITPYINDCPYGYRIEGKLNKRVKKGGRRSVSRAARDRSLSPEEQMVQLMLVQNQTSKSPTQNISETDVATRIAEAAKQAAQPPAPIPAP